MPLNSGLAKASLRGRVTPILIGRSRSTFLGSHRTADERVRRGSDAKGWGDVLSPVVRADAWHQCNPAAVFSTEYLI